MPGEELDSLEKATRGLPVWVKSLVFIVVAVLIGYNTYKTIMMDLFPDKFATEVEQATIHKDVKSLKEEVENALRVEINKELSKASWKHRAIEDKIESSKEILLDTILSLKTRAKKHREFNTIVNSIQSDLLTEMMEKKNNPCDWVYYETHTGDNWKVFPDKYNCKVPYSLDLRSDCRAYYTPINGSKTRAN